MFYVVSIALVGLAGAGLGLVALRSLRPLRACRATASMVSDRTGDRIGMLRARAAAVRVAVDERRARRR